MRRPFVLFLICISTTINAFPSPSDDSMVVVTSTETPAKESNDGNDNDKTVSTPTIPKIYEMKIDTNVTNRYATTLITSKVKNLAATAQEATFSVVLPETAYISGFIMEIDGKSYKAYVKEKEEAKQIYDTAVQSGQAAAHVSARDSNRFTVAVNVAPTSKAIFRLTYEELLQRQNDQYEIVLNIHPGQPVKNLMVDVHINETRPLKFVKSPSLRSGNEINKNDENLNPHADIDIINATSSIVHFSPNEEKQKQFAHGLGTKEEHGLSGQFIVQYDVERDPSGGEVLVKDGYFVHFFAPNDLQPLPKHVVFVLDTSGSMDGIRIQQLKQAMNSILSELKTEDVFNIIEFNSIVKAWDIDQVKVVYQQGEDPWNYPRQPENETKPAEQTLPSSFQANADNIKKAKEVVGKLNAYGGTDIQSGLQLGLKLVKENKDEHQPLIVFLTDGEPTVGEITTDKIISTIKEQNGGGAPIFSLSFGDGADRDFLQKISLKNQGFARHIYEAADASLQLEEFYKQISSPLLSNVTFEYVSNVTKTTKTNFPILFRGGELVVAGQIDLPSIDPGFAPGSIHGWGPHGPIVLKPTIVNSLGALEKLWAYLTVRQILEARDAADDKTEYTKKALDIALKYEFVTPVSSLVVVKPNDTSAVNTEDASKVANDRGRPYFAQKSFIGAARPLGLYATSTMALKGPTFAQGLSGLSTTRLYQQPIFYEEDVDAFESYPSTTVSTDKFAILKSQFAWLTKILSENGTLTTPTGGYTLGTDQTITTHPDCPEIPGNNTAGICSLLLDCPQVHSLLTDEQIFTKHVCLMGNIAGICCPKPTTTTTTTTN